MQAFRETVRSFLNVALTPSLRQAGLRTTGLSSAPEACAIWHQRLYRAGWIAPAWPREFGGAGWSLEQRAIFDEECARHDAPVLFSAGIRSIGPLLIERGNLHQRAYLPAILRGDEIWCQGFSEPEAGSDLGAIKSAAHKLGDAYVLNGQKLWTSGAHLARRMFGLFRTDPQSQGGAGLSFFLIDMQARGVKVSPLRDLNGDHEFNQVFFEDVMVSVDDVVGKQDQGWEIAKRLMALARANNSPSAHVRRLLKRIGDAIDEATPQAQLLQFAALEIELEAFCVLEQRQMANLSSDAKASMLKLQGSELKQKACALALDIGCVTPRDDVTPSVALLQKQYFSSRAASIYSGTSEIHRNLIARAMLR